MTHLKSLCVAMVLSGLTGCATNAEEVKPAAGEPAVLASVDDSTLGLQLRIGDLENQLEVKNHQIAELTDMLVAAELARTDHLVAGSDR